MGDEDEVVLVFDEEGVRRVVVGVLVVTRKLPLPIDVTPQSETSTGLTSGSGLGYSENVHLTKSESK